MPDKRSVFILHQEKKDDEKGEHDLVYPGAHSVRLY
jgi:hypothetical protein